MLVTNFVQEFNKAEDKTEFVQQHIVTYYIPYEKKMAICKNVINGADYSPNIDVINKKYYCPNTPMRFVFFCMSIVDSYTDIKCKNSTKKGEKYKDILGGFNLLDEVGYFEILFNLLGREYQMFNTVLHMTVNDTADKENSLVGYLTTKFDSFEKVYDTILPIIEERIANFPTLEN